MRRAVVFTTNKYPNGDAGALRQHVVAKLLVEIGFQVMIYGMGTSTDGEVLKFDGISYMSMRRNRKGMITRIYDRLFWGRKACRDFQSRFDHVDVILVIDDNPFLFHRLEKIHKRTGCVLIHDSVEWYSPEEFKSRKLSIQYQLKNYINKHSINQNWNIIAISKYLYDWFSNKANTVVRIPVIMDMNSEDNLEREYAERIRFVYAGSPGLKDCLKDIVSGFAKLELSDRNRVELHIIGVNHKQLVNQCCVDETDIIKLGDSLVIHGRLDHSESVNWVHKSDYTVLLRDPFLRYAKAGFPTKIVESLKYGTPPLCNISSDLGEYLFDGENSIIINGKNDIAVCDAVKRAINIDKNQYNNMRINSRKTAVNNFSPERYLKDIQKLISD